MVSSFCIKPAYQKLVCIVGQAQFNAASTDYEQSLKQIQQTRFEL